MDLEEAKNKVKISSEEREAVGDYINIWHASMNAIIGFDAKNYSASSKEGWLLPGIDTIKKEKPETEEEKIEQKRAIGKEVLKAIEKAGLVYSAMVKSMYDCPPPIKLMRGTSNKEASSLREGSEYKRILSTTTDETVAKSFGRAGDCAFLRIIPGDGIPFINVNEFVGKDNLNRQEEEYILAPFTKVKNSTFRSDWNGFKYYDVSLEKPEMRAFEDGEKAKLEEDILLGFADIVVKGQKMAQIYDTLDLCRERLSRSKDKEDRIFYSEKQKDAFDEMDALAPELKEFEEKMHKYVQGIFSEKEREIQQAHEITHEEEIRLLKEEREKREKAQIEESTNDIKENAPKLKSVVDKLPAGFVSTYQKLADEELRFSKMAQILGVPFTNHVSNNGDMKENISRIETNIANIKEKLEEITGAKFDTSKEAMVAVSTLNNYEVLANTLQESQKTGYNIIMEYADESLFEMKKGVDEKIQGTILNTKYQLLQMKKQEIENRKISFFGRIRGLGRLKELELANIALEENILKNTTIQPKKEYSIQDALADMRVFSIRELGGQNTEEMQQIANSVRQVFGFNESEVERRAQIKLNSVPMVISDRKKPKTSEKIQKAEEKNASLKAELIDTQNSRNNSVFGAYKQNTATLKFADMLRNAVRISTVYEPEINNQRQAQFGDDHDVK